jgi:hypothetical protein
MTSEKATLPRREIYLAEDEAMRTRSLHLNLTYQLIYFYIQ